MKVKILAIDMGWSGALAFQVGDEIGVRDCPGDCHGMVSFLRWLKRKYGKEGWDVVLEANTPSPHFGARGNFGLGVNIGSWESALASQGFSWEPINPKAWQKITNNIRSRHKKGRKMRKEKAWKFARNTFPFLADELGDKVPAPTNPRQGRADALCILEWKRRE